MTSREMEAIGRIQQGTVILDAPSMEWQPTDTPGFYMKPLFKDHSTGEATFLMKMDPGAHAPNHSHQQFEEILVLEGDFYDADRRYTVGQFCVRAIGAEHEAGSKNGGVVLLIYRN